MIDVLLCATGSSTLGTKILYNNLKNAGLSVDVAQIPFNVIEKIIAFRPKIVSIAWFHVAPTYEFIMEVLPKIRKKFPEIKFVFGGYNSTYDWIHLKDYKYCDYIVGGEADDALVDCCKDILEGKPIDKLTYLNHPLPDLSKYDYDHNFIATGKTLIFETGRSCVFAMKKRCWYCSQLQNPYRRLDIEKVKEGIKKNLKNENNLFVVDPEIMPENLNDLYKTFKLPMFCFLIPQHHKYVSDEVENCTIETGYDIYKDSTNYQHNDTAQYLDDILRVARKNKVILSTVIKDKSEFPLLMEEVNRLADLSPNINFQFNNFTMMPGVDNKPYSIDIYKNKQDLEFFEDEPSFELKPVDLEGWCSFNVFDLAPLMEPYKSAAELPGYITENFPVRAAYRMYGVTSFVVDKEYKDQLEKICYITSFASDSNLIKCIIMR